MNDISVAGLSKFFGERQILKNITFDIYEGKKAALVGKNGTGKTTLLNIISGRLGYDSGSLFVNTAKNPGVLDQIPKYPGDASVREVLESAFAPVYALGARMRGLEEAMKGQKGDGALLSEYGSAAQRFEALGGYETELRLKKVSNGLAIPESMWERAYAALSGGEMTRVNLARLLLQDSGILLLDEPTNHLDLKSLEWLEDFLSAYRGTVLLISHDRFFLDRVSDMTIELSNMEATVYNGNYSFYAERKEEEERLALSRYNQAEKEIKRLEFTSRRMHGWGLGNKKMMRRAFALDKRIERIRARRPDRPKGEKNLRGRLSEAERSGSEVLIASELSMGFGDRELFSGADLFMEKDDAVALTGDNGTGKTTLLRILLGELSPKTGHVKWGANIKMAYLPQNVRFENESLTVLETLTGELLMTDGPARNRLGAFLFTNDDVFKPVRVLSGGEKSRLRLCILLAREINTLILDEPTNHLDIASREWLEGILEGFEGTMLFISHDRYFVSRFATKIWNLEEGAIEEFDGSYEEFREAQKRREQLRDARPKPGPPEKKKPPRSVSPEKQAKKLERERKKLEERIAEAEGRIAEIDSGMEQNASDHLFLTEACALRDREQTLLSGLYESWEAVLSELEEGEARE